MKRRLISSSSERYQQQVLGMLRGSMQSGFFLFYFLAPVFTNGCCVINYQNKFTGFQQDAKRLYYKAVEGEIIMMPCVNQNMTTWSRTEEGKEGNKGPSFDCGKMFVAEVKHSGNYTNYLGILLSSGSKFVLHLQVLEKITLGCFLQNESSVMLRVQKRGEVPCPGLTCSNNTGVVWFKGSKPVSTQRRTSCVKDGGFLQLCEVYIEDTGVYFCDIQMNEKGVMWILKRAVNVTVVPQFKARTSPDIRHPSANKTEEVVLGQPHNLTCEVYFDFEIEFSPKVQWFINYGGITENKTPLHMEVPLQRQVRLSQSVLFEVIQTAIINEVTPQHLDHTYTCIATNTVGNTSVTIKLERKCQVQWPSLVGYPLVSFLVVAVLGVTLHVKWLELTIICRSHFKYGKIHREEKEFDVFLSYVWGSSIPSSVEVDRGLTLYTRAGPQDHEEDLLNTEGRATQRPLEMLLPQVLEDQWGYRLCLLERDVLPGGAYANDVVLAIKKSQMLICVLSEDYLASSNAVFVLESGIQALLQNSVLKLLLIWTSGHPPSLINPDLPLPKLVQRALRVLPSLDWSIDESSTTTFWSSLRKAMPTHRMMVKPEDVGKMSTLAEMQKTHVTCSKVGKESRPLRKAQDAIVL